jgi:hypothetical protein
VARLYSDENFPLPVVERLRHLGHDVLSIQQTGRAGEGVPDSEVFAVAIRERRAVLTLNRNDFKRLHRATRNIAVSSSARLTKNLRAKPSGFTMQSKICGHWMVCLFA